MGRGDLTVPNAEDEPGYLPPLEAVGFRLIFRDNVGGDVHRQLTLGSPNTNLHVWSPRAAEPQRHDIFSRWLRAHEADQERYGAAKRLAASGDASRRYNDSKSAVIYDIYERAFLADPSHLHDPHPRCESGTERLDRLGRGRATGRWYAVEGKD